MSIVNVVKCDLCGRTSENKRLFTQVEINDKQGDSKVKDYCIFMGVQFTEKESTEFETNKYSCYNIAKRVLN